MVTLSKEQRAALESMLSGDNVFLTGKAGTGKSTVLKAFRKTHSKPTLYVAPTGIAALNIDGQTIHSCFQIKPGMMSDLEPIASKKRLHVLRNARTIVIDEISMVRSDLLAAVDARLRQVAKGNDVDKPFGGKQLIVIGDFLQLPPVVENESIHGYLSMRYGGVYAFQTSAWESAQFQVKNLNKVYRQADEEFIDILNTVRVGECTSLDSLAHRSEEPLTEDSVVLTPYRARADAINTEKLNKLPEPEVTFTASIEGKFTKDTPVDYEITLRVGARVMLAVNKYTADGDLIYANGTLGTVVSLSAAGCSVTIRTDDKRTLTITSHVWKMYEFDYSGSSVVAQEVGSFTQLPIRLAWSVTIHRSQGCTFDKVHLDLGRGCFAPGQLYTALSRVRTLNGLTLSRPLKTTDLRTAPEVLQFSHSLVTVERNYYDKRCCNS